MERDEFLQIRGLCKSFHGTEVLKNNAGSYMVAGMTRGGGSHE